MLTYLGRETVQRRILGAINMARWDKELLYGVVATCETCRSCRFQMKGDVLAYKKCYCDKYPEKKGVLKPKDVMFNGASCKYYKPKTE